jgi:hypothetical protein
MAHARIFDWNTEAVGELPANTAFQPTRCAPLALQDRRHFDTTANLSMLYPRSERLNAGRYTAWGMVSLENQRRHSSTGRL